MKDEVFLQGDCVGTVRITIVLFMWDEKIKLVWECVGCVGTQPTHYPRIIFLRGDIWVGQ